MKEAEKTFINAIICWEIVEICVVNESVMKITKMENKIIFKSKLQKLRGNKIKDNTFSFIYLKWFLLRVGGQVVMGGDSWSEGYEFECQHHILDGHFFTLISCKNCIDVCLKNSENNDKEAGDCQFFKRWFLLTSLPRCLQTQA